jgi:hypothetical protein
MPPTSTTGRTLRTAAAGALLASAVIALLLQPAFSASQRPEDWYQHIWYVWHQGESIRANKVPSLFAYNTPALFNPHYAFYGGTLYAAVGSLGLLLGSAQTAFNISVVAAFAAAYGGWYWLARQASLGPWTSHLPGLLFITSPYYINIVYRTGAWAELIAVSAIPLLLASGISVLRATRLRAVPALALAASTIFLTGSHNITLLWGSVVLAVTLTVTLACVPDARRQITRRGAKRVALIMLPALLVNAWFLLPDIAYQSMTYAASLPRDASLQWADVIARPKYLFTLGRPANSPEFYVLALPVVAALWVLVGTLVAGRERRSSWFRLVLILLGAMAGLLALMLSTGVLVALPGPLPMIQFGFRLESYILLCLSGAVIGLLRLAATRSHNGAAALWRWAGVAVVALAIVQAAGQARVTHPFPRGPNDKEDVHAYLTAALHPSELDYVDPKIISSDGTAGEVNFPVTAEHGNEASLTLPPIVGQRVVTNVVVMPPLVTITGADFVGHSKYGGAIFQVTDTTTPGSATITVKAAHPWPVTLGLVLSIIGLLGLLANAIAIALAHRRRRPLARRDHLELNTQRRPMT